MTDRLDTLEKAVSRIEALMKQHQRDNNKEKRKTAEGKVEQKLPLTDIPEKHETEE